MWGKLSPPQSDQILIRVHFILDKSYLRVSSTMGRDMCSKNNVGDSIEPCGMPALMSMSSKQLPSTMALDASP